MKIQVLLFAILVITQKVYALRDRGVWDTVSQTLSLQLNKFSFLSDPQELVESWGRVYDTLTQNENYKRYWRERHETSGAYRSGEGTRAEIQERIRQQKEQQMIKEIYDKGEYVADKNIERKLQEMFIKEFNEQHIRNDDIDLVPHHEFTNPLPSAASLQPLQGRNLQQTGSESVTVKTLNEPYPNGACNDSGQLVNQTQLYYLCEKYEEPKDQFRVDRKTYDKLINEFSSIYDCKTENVTKEVCVCPQGYYGYSCGTQLQTKCFLNITDPPFYKGCEKEDSPYYMYSIPGYDPCFFLNFSSTYDVKFLLICKTENETGEVIASKENVGYAYRDVIDNPVFNSFNYVATNPETKFSLFSPRNVTVALDFRDWQWLSNKMRFETIVQDPSVTVGNQEGTLTVDFSQLEQSDSNKESYFVVGGRTYFEGNVYGKALSSFTTKGFFDKQGYQEPVGSSSKNKGLIIGLSIGLVALVLIVVSFVLYKCKQNKKQKQSQTHLD